MKTWIAALALISILGFAGGAAADGSTRRFAYAIGANDGGKGRVALRYAGTDAEAFVRVLRELGGAQPADVRVLIDPSAAEIEAGFTALARELAAARATGVRVEVIVYYSGHSDEHGLLIAGAELGYGWLRDRIGQLPADLHIAILDSCASGAFTRAKGGARRPAFLVDESHRVQGRAYLTASSASEEAQESDRIGGSFFTHFFVGGLRGAADANGDGRVMLGEAYQFAFAETVARTESTRHGAQHPAYDMQLAGTGDVILTDLRADTAALVLSKDLAGRVSVRDHARRPVVELGKQRGSEVVLGLGAGTYHVTVAAGGSVRGATTRVAAGARSTLAPGQLTAVASEDAVARGGAAAPPPPPPPSPPSGSPIGIELVHVPRYGDPSRHALALNLLVGGGGQLSGFELGGLVNVRTGEANGVQLAGIGNVAAADASALQVAGIFNVVSGRGAIGQIAGIANWTGSAHDGFQVAGVANLAKAAVAGPQIAGVANVAASAPLQISGVAGWTTGDVGLQLGGVASWAGGGAGLQIAGVTSWSRRRASQIAGVVNWAVEGPGVMQVAGVTNVSERPARGLQLAGVANVAPEGIHGAQIGTVNVGGELRGAQIGVVNIAARISGTQIGVINIATESGKGGVPIGLVNVAPDGYRAAEAWLSDVIPARLGVKVGSGPVYTLAAIGVGRDYVAGGLGLGVHLPARDYWIDLDVASYAVRTLGFEETDIDQLAELRGMVGTRLSDQLGVFAGAALNAALSYDDDGREVGLLTFKQIETEDVSAWLSPSLFVGISH